MCNKCNPHPCGCNYKKSPCGKDISTDDIVYDNTVEIPCFGIQPGTPLTEALQTIGATVCDIRDELTSASAVLINTGDGQGVYSSDTPAGAKQLKTISGSTSIDVTSTTEEITVAINQEYIDSLILNSVDENIVEFNTSNPNTGSPTFIPNTPQDEDAVYFSTVNGSFWKWTGANYATYDPPNSTPFVISNTTNDSGGNKTADISRAGKVRIGNTGTPAQTLHVDGIIRQQYTTTMLKGNASGDIVPALAGTDYLTPTGSAAQLTAFPILNQNTTGNAATVTTIPTLTGDVSNIGNNVILNASGVTAGTYNSANVTVNTKGIITAITAGGGSRSLVDFMADSGNLASTLTPLYQFNIPANIFSTNGDKLDIYYSGSLNTPGASKTIGFQFGSSSYSESTTSNGSFYLKVNIMRINATTLKYNFDIVLNNVAKTHSSQFTSVDLTVPINIRLNGTGVNALDVTARFGNISFYPASV